MLETHTHTEFRFFDKQYDHRMCPPEALVKADVSGVTAANASAGDGAAQQGTAQDRKPAGNPGFSVFGWCMLSGTVKKHWLVHIAQAISRRPTVEGLGLRVQGLRARIFPNPLISLALLQGSFFSYRSGYIR